MAITLTIGGVSKNFVGGSLRLSYTANYHTTASFSVRSNDGSYRPAYDAEVVISRDGTPILGGLIDKPGERGTMGDMTGASEAILTNVTVVDFSAYTARRYVTETLAAGTLKSMLTTLVTNYLNVYGITLSGSQPDGPTLPDIVATDELLVDLLNRLSTLTAKYGEQYVWSVDPSKVLLMAQPSTVPAPYNIPSDDAAVGDIKVETIGDRYANRVTVIVPTQTQPGRTETFTAGASQTVYNLQYTVSGWQQGYVSNSDTGNNETLGLPGDPANPFWTYDPTANTLTRNMGAPATGSAISFTFDGFYNGRGVATDASWTTKPRERIVKLPTAPSDTTVQAFAEALLARYLSLGKTISYKTFAAGLLPGQSQHVTFAPRDLDDDVIITSVVATDYLQRGRRLLYDVTAVTGTIVPEQFQDTYLLWSGDTGGGSATQTTTAGAGSPTSTGPANPYRSVQFNDGAFGGDDAFIYYKDENSVVCGGGGSSIAAADFESCQVFGYDCHIADPS